MDAASTPPPAVAPAGWHTLNADPQSATEAFLAHWHREFGDAPVTANVVWRTIKHQAWRRERHSRLQQGTSLRAQRRAAATGPLPPLPPDLCVAALHLADANRWITRPNKYEQSFSTINEAKLTAWLDECYSRTAGGFVLEAAPPEKIERGNDRPRWRVRTAAVMVKR